MSVLRDYLLLRAHAGYATYWVSWVGLLAILFGGVFLFAAVLPAPGAFIIALTVVVGIAWLVICSARARDMRGPGNMRRTDPGARGGVHSLPVAWAFAK